jgi:hypothetical protein
MAVLKANKASVKVFKGLFARAPSQCSVEPSFDVHPKYLKTIHKADG